MRLPPWLALAALVCVPPAVLATPLDLIVNGDFEDDLAVGWFERLDASSATIVRTATAHPDPDYEVWMSVANGVGELGLVQRFEVPNPDLTVTADVEAFADGTGGAWAVAGLMLTYRDRDWSVLGTTAAVYTSRDCPWTDSPTFHMIEIGAGSWETISFALADELASLPGIDAEAIAWLDVAVMIEAENC